MTLVCDCSFPLIYLTRPDRDMASSGGGGASVQSTSGKPKKKKELPASNVFTAMIGCSLMENQYGALVLLTENNTVLGVVARDTAGALGDTVSRAYGLPSKKNVLLTLGLCRVDLNVHSTSAFETGNYTAADVLAITTGSHVALWRIIKGARHKPILNPLDPHHRCRRIMHYPLNRCTM